jgi:gamma-glutamyltranspeptidase/glutathione hydrolase/leukotriene-C4 hydrolase
MKNQDGIFSVDSKLLWVADKPPLPLHSQTSPDSRRSWGYAHVLLVSFLFIGSLWHRGAIYRWYKDRGYFHEDHTRDSITTRNPAYLIEAKHGAVASENKRCSVIGVDVMKEGGNAVDAAIATTFCVGVVNMFSYIRPSVYPPIIQFTATL